MSNLKMSDVFDGDLIQDADTLFANGYGELAEFNGYKKEARYVAHAVNAHDKLVEQNAKLLRELCDIQSACIGDIAMGRNLCAQSIGESISAVTGMSQPELHEYLNGLEKN